MKTFAGDSTTWFTLRSSQARFTRPSWKSFKNCCPFLKRPRYGWLRWNTVSSTASQPCTTSGTSRLTCHGPLQLSASRMYRTSYSGSMRWGTVCMYTTWADVSESLGGGVTYPHEHPLLHICKFVSPCLTFSLLYIESLIFIVQFSNVARLSHSYQTRCLLIYYIDQ